MVTQKQVEKTPTEAMKIKAEVRNTPEYKALEAEWQKVQDLKGADNPYAQRLKNDMIKMEDKALAEAKAKSVVGRENPYLRMPIERVRQDAEKGVLLAKEALEVRKPTLPKAEAAQPSLTKAVPEPAIAKEGVKEPWMMTRSDFFASERQWRKSMYPKWTKRQIEEDIPLGTTSATHREVVRDALAEGKPVPESVLADYPDLMPKTGMITPKEGIAPIKGTPKEYVITDNTGVRFYSDEVLGVGELLPEGKTVGKIELARRSIAPEKGSGIPKEGVKEPWQYGTQRDYVVQGLEKASKWATPPKTSVQKAQVTKEIISEHKRIIEQALREGKPVPESVLADYPDLKAPVAPEKGVLNSIIPEGKDVLPLITAYKLAKAKGLVKTQAEFRALLEKELSENLVWGGSGTSSRLFANRQLGSTKFGVTGYIERVAPEKGVGEVGKPQYMTTEPAHSALRTTEFPEKDTLQARDAFIKEKAATRQDIKKYNLPPGTIALFGSDPVPVGYVQVHAVERISTKNKVIGGTYYFAPKVGEGIASKEPITKTEKLVEYLGKSIKSLEEDIAIQERQKAKEAEKFAYKGEERIKLINETWDKQFIEPKKEQLEWLKEQLEVAKPSPEAIPPAEAAKPTVAPPGAPVGVPTAPANITTEQDLVNWYNKEFLDATASIRAEADKIMQETKGTYEERLKVTDDWEQKQLQPIKDAWMIKVREDAKSRGIALTKLEEAVSEGVPPAEPPSLLSVPLETVLPMPDNVNVSEDRVVRPPPPPKIPPPPEPPATHPPQPAPMEAGRITMPDLQPSQQVVDMYSRPDFWRNVANLPIVKKAVGLFNPAAVANDPARQALILRVALKDEGVQKAQAVISHLWEIGTQERIWGKTDELGLLTKEPFGTLPLDEIRTYPDKYSAQMTDKQKEWIKRAEEIEKVKLEALRRNGIEINELSFEDGGRYAGRRVMGKFNDTGELIESGRIGVGGRVGAKQPFEKTRVFKDAFDGIQAGYRYMNSDEALYYNVVGAYNKIADKQMSEWILTKVDWRTTAAPESLVLQAESAKLRLRKAQQLLAALNRAVRGERVPSSTINSIASVYSDQADTLKSLIPELQKPFPETADVVQILDAEAKALISETRVEYYHAVDKRARAREEALRVKYEEASIAHPAFQGKIFTGTEAKEIADILRAGLQPQYIEALGAVNKVNAIGRFFMLAGDASPMAIQLQFLAFYRPKAYAKAWGGFVKALFDPEFQYRQYANNRDLINRHPTLILSGRGTEFTEFMGRGGLGQKLGVLAKPLVPFQKAFEGCLDTAGIELAKSLDHLATTPERTHDIDQFINEFRGITSSARIGVSSLQRQAETAIILAPRYNRAIAGYLFDVVHGGLRGHLARMSLAQGFAGLAAMAVAISIQLGEDEAEIWEHFNPESPKFYTWDVMGVKVGLGGKVRSVLKMFGNMTRKGEVGQPARNFLRGNLSPGAGTGLDLITGKNYIGEPTRDNVLNFTKTVGRNFMMIWTQNLLLEGGTLQDKAIIATAEFFGLRGYDISAKKELKIKDLEEMLGQRVGKTPVLSKKKPDIYDTRNIYSDVKRLLQYTPPEEVLADKGYVGLGHTIVRIEQSEANRLPDIKLKDYNLDSIKGDTLSDYMKQWTERQKITEAGERAEYTRVKIVEGKEERTEFKGLAALIAHKVDYPKAQLGNVTRRQRALLLDYDAAIDKKQFIKDNPDIEINPKTDYLKNHPKDNAEFAIFGQAKILTQAAYDEAQRLIKALDIPGNAVSDFLPPKEVAKASFEYQDAENSWEKALILAKNQKLADYLKVQVPESPIASLELKVDKTYRETYEKLTKDTDPDWIGNLDDEKKDTLVGSPTYGKTKRQIARDELNATKIPGTDLTYLDMERKIAFIEKGTNDKPIDPLIVDAGVEFKKLVPGSAEANLFRADDKTGLDAFLTDKVIWARKEGIGDDAMAPIDRNMIPIWTMQANDRDYTDTIELYKTKTLPDGTENPDWKDGDLIVKDGKTAREIAVAELRGKNPEAFANTRRIEVYSHFINKAKGEGVTYVAPDPAIVESHVKHMEIIDDGGKGVGAKSSLFRVKDAVYDAWRTGIPEGQEFHLEPLDRTQIPIWETDVKYEKQDTELQAIRDKYPGVTVEQTAEVKKYLDNNQAYKIASYERDARKLGLNEGYIQEFAKYKDSSPAKQNLILKQRPDFQEVLWKANNKGNEDMYTVSPEYQYIQGKRVEGLKLEVKWEDKLSEWDAIKDNYSAIVDETTKKSPADIKREQMLMDKKFADAYYRIKAYDYKSKAGYTIRDTYNNPNAKTTPIDDYVSYQMQPGKPKLKPGEKDAGFYEDDWWLQAHPDYYKEVYLGVLGNERKDYRKVPTRVVFTKYVHYLNNLVTGKPREDYRRENPDLEDWLLLAGKVTTSIKEKARREELSPAEKLAEELAKRPSLMKGYWERKAKADAMRLIP